MEEKYLKLLDAETLEFVRHTEAFYPPDAINATIEEQRAFYDALCTEFDTGYPEGVSASDRWINAREGDFKIRDYTFAGTAPRAHILYFHGGGFVVGGLESHDSICAEFCARTQCSLTAVDYRLAPEFPHPAAYDDCLNAFHRISRENSDLPIILAGDSAGGTLAASVSHAVRGETTAPAGQLLIYPALGGSTDQGSYVEHAHAPMLTLADIGFYTHVRSAGVDIGGDVTAIPLADRNFSNLPPTVIITAECDPLASDGETYRDALKAGGSRAEWINEKGMVHGYLRARHTVKRAGESFSRMVIALNMFADGRWDFD